MKDPGMVGQRYNDPGKMGQRFRDPGQMGDPGGMGMKNKKDPGGVAGTYHMIHQWVVETLLLSKVFYS